MNTGRLLFAFCLIGLVVVGCTAVPDPTPTPENVAGEVATVVATRPEATSGSPSSTATLIPPTPTETEIPATSTAVPIPTDLPVSTDAPQPTPTFTPYPTATPLTLPPLTWTESVKLVTTMDVWKIIWSSIANEFVFDLCADEFLPSPEPFNLAISTAPSFETGNISLPDIVCPAISDYMWHIDGQHIVFSGTPITEGDNFYADIWILNRKDQDVRHFDRVGKFLDFAGWMDDNTLVYRDHWGGGNWKVYLLDISKNTEIASAYVHASDINALAPDFVVTNDGMQHVGPYSAAAIAREIVAPDNPCSPYLKLLSRDQVGCYGSFSFNSRYTDFLPNKDQVLVTTWNANEYLTDTIHTKTDLQLWNLETDELTLLISDGLDGRFSPDGQYLAYTASGADSSSLYLLDRGTGEILFTQPYEWPFAFSPDGRTLTFYSPTPELMLYDLETGEFLPPLTAVPFTPLWSPDSSRFVFQHPSDGLSIFDRRSHTTYPLATSGGERLSNPQWSYDGTYLSVTVQQEDGRRHTAVLQLP